MKRHRIYYVKSPGWFAHEVWWRWSDDRADTDGRTEYRALDGRRFWFWETAFLVAVSLQIAFDDGAFEHA